MAGSMAVLYRAVGDESAVVVERLAGRRGRLAGRREVSAPWRERLAEVAGGSGEVAQRLRERREPSGEVAKSFGDLAGTFSEVAERLHDFAETSSDFAKTFREVGKCFSDLGERLREGAESIHEVLFASRRETCRADLKRRPNFRFGRAREEHFSHRIRATRGVEQADAGERSDARRGDS